MRVAQLSPGLLLGYLDDMSLTTVVTEGLAFRMSIGRGQCGVWSMLYCAISMVLRIMLLRLRPFILGRESPLTGLMS